MQSNPIYLNLVYAVDLKVDKQSLKSISIVIYPFMWNSWLTRLFLSFDFTQSIVS